MKIDKTSWLISQKTCIRMYPRFADFINNSDVFFYIFFQLLKDTQLLFIVAALLVVDVSIIGLWVSLDPMHRSVTNFTSVVSLFLIRIAPFPPGSWKSVNASTNTTSTPRWKLFSQINFL